MQHFIFIGSFLVLLLPATAAAHPVAQGAMDAVVKHERIEVVLRVSLEEIFVTNALASEGEEGEGNLPELFRLHGEYLLDHLFIEAEGEQLLGSVREIIPAGVAVRSGDRELPPAPTLVSYRIDFEPVDRGEGIGAPGSVVPIQFTQNILNEFEYAPGNRWEATFLSRVSQPGLPAFEGSLFTSRDPLLFTADLSASAAATTASRNASSAAEGTPAPQAIGPLLRSYFTIGAHHILEGIDHLLFAIGLVLAAATLRELILVVTAFTVAHTVTLVLSVLNLVSLSPTIVEPLIAFSIVVVALQNLFAPKSSSGAFRLATAFGFGLFHGLGFAGGLREAMQSLGAEHLGWALAAFSAGVEVGHQIVILPIFALLTLVTRYPPRGAMIRTAALRAGSAAVACGGFVFLYASLSA